jgi:hypothetical protein
VCDCVAQNDASVKCWGYNLNGKLGLGDKITRGDDPFGECAARRGCLVGSALLSGQGFVADEDQPRRASDPGRCLGAEMGANLPAVDLGPGMTAVSIAAGESFTCAILVGLERRNGGIGSTITAAYSAAWQGNRCCQQMFASG